MAKIGKITEKCNNKRFGGVFGVGERARELRELSDVARKRCSDGEVLSVREKHSGENLSVLFILSIFVAEFKITPMRINVR